MQGPGLKKEGVVTLQTLAIILFSWIEFIFRQGFGIVTGFVMLATFILGNRFGRNGTAFVAAVTPPIAFASFALLISILHNGIHISKLFIDFIGSLASIAPWMLFGALFAWYQFLRWRRSNSM